MPNVLSFNLSLNMFKSLTFAFAIFQAPFQWGFTKCPVQFSFGIRVISVVIIFGNALRLLRNVPRQAFSVILVTAAILVPLLWGFSAFWTIIVCGAAGIISVLIDPSVIEPKGAEVKKGKG